MRSLKIQRQERRVEQEQRIWHRARGDGYQEGNPSTSQVESALDKRVQQPDTTGIDEFYRSRFNAQPSHDLRSDPPVIAPFLPATLRRTVGQPLITTLEELAHFALSGDSQESLLRLGQVRFTSVVNESTFGQLNQLLSPVGHRSALTVKAAIKPNARSRRSQVVPRCSNRLLRSGSRTGNKTERESNRAWMRACRPIAGKCSS